MRFELDEPGQPQLLRLETSAFLFTVSTETAQLAKVLENSAHLLRMILPVVSLEAPRVVAPGDLASTRPGMRIGTAAAYTDAVEDNISDSDGSRVPEALFFSVRTHGGLPLLAYLSKTLMIFRRSLAFHDLRVQLFMHREQLLVSFSASLGIVRGARTLDPEIRSFSLAGLRRLLLLSQKFPQVSLPRLAGVFLARFVEIFLTRFVGVFLARLVEVLGRTGRGGPCVEDLA
jgi:hypothetical protein